VTIPPEPRAVRWYFEHRLPADPTGYTPTQIATNDLLWRMVCEQGIEGGEKVLGGAPGEAQDAVVNTEATPQPCVNRTASQDRHGAGYMREYMRKKRAAQRPP